MAEIHDAFGIEPAAARRSGHGTGSAGPAAEAALTCVTCAVIVLVALIAFASVPNLAPVPGGGPSGDRLIRAYGATLPVLAAAAPIVTLVLYRVRPQGVLLAGLALLGVVAALTVVPGGPDTRAMPAVAVLRSVQGLGAGAALPASLALAWQRAPSMRRVTTAIWAAACLSGLILAEPLARAVPGPLPRHPWAIGAALLLAALLLVAAPARDPHRRASGRRPPDVPAPRDPAPRDPASRAPGHPAGAGDVPPLLVAPLLPAAGVATLGIGTTFDWTPRGLLIAAAAAVAAVGSLAIPVCTELRRSAGGGTTWRGRGTAWWCAPLVAATAGLCTLPVFGALAGRYPPAEPVGCAVVGVLAGVAATIRSVRRTRGPWRGHPPGSRRGGAPRRMPAVGLAVTAAGFGLLASGALPAIASSWPSGRVTLALGIVAFGLGFATGSTLTTAERLGALLAADLLLAALPAGYLVVGAGRGYAPEGWAMGPAALAAVAALVALVVGRAPRRPGSAGYPAAGEAPYGLGRDPRPSAPYGLDRVPSPTPPYGLERRAAE